LKVENSEFKIDNGQLTIGEFIIHNSKFIIDNYYWCDKILGSAEFLRETYDKVTAEGTQE